MSATPEFTGPLTLGSEPSADPEFDSAVAKAEADAEERETAEIAAAVFSAPEKPTQYAKPPLPIGVDPLPMAEANEVYVAAHAAGYGQEALNSLAYAISIAVDHKGPSIDHGTKETEAVLRKSGGATVAPTSSPSRAPRRDC